MSDKAGRAYWDSVWQAASAKFVSPAQPGWKHAVSREIARCWTQLLKPYRGGRLLEVGCAHSRWLPFFAQELGFDAWGVDYSAVGCETTRELLRSAGANGTVVSGDMFYPPPELLGAFDVVVSQGLFEHFEDSDACARALTAFAKPDGIVVTMVPNMRGLLGFLQRRLDRAVYDIHVPLSLEQLVTAHERSGLRTVACEYVLFVNFAVLTLGNMPTANRMTRRALRLLDATSVMFSLAAERGVRLPTNRWSSPFLLYAGKRTSGTRGN